MNLTINNTPYRYNQYNNQCKPRPNFNGNIANSVSKAAGEVEKELSSNSSKFFAPFTKMFDQTSEWLCQKVAKPVLGSNWFGGFAEKVQNADNLFQHCLTTGSVITSGLYMQRTLANKDMDKDRKNTLAVNQFLTLCVSTAGAYTMDKYLKNWWENMSAKYVGHKVLDDTFAKDYKDVKDAINNINKALKADGNADIFKLAETSKKELNMTEKGYKFLTDTITNSLDKAKETKEELKSLKSIKLDKFIDKLVKQERIPKLTSGLKKQITGFGLLRSMIVFGFVYRYFVPVAVTKPANKLCDMYLEHKKAKEAAQKTA